MVENIAAIVVAGQRITATQTILEHMGRTPVDGPHEGGKPMLGRTVMPEAAHFKSVHHALTIARCRPIGRIAGLVDEKRRVGERQKQVEDRLVATPDGRIDRQKPSVVYIVGVGAPLKQFGHRRGGNPRGRVERRAVVAGALYINRFLVVAQKTLKQVQDAVTGCKINIGASHARAQHWHPRVIGMTEQGKTVFTLDSNRLRKVVIIEPVDDRCNQKACCLSNLVCAGPVKTWSATRPPLQGIMGQHRLPQQRFPFPLEPGISNVARYDTLRGKDVRHAS